MRNLNWGSFLINHLEYENLMKSKLEKLIDASLNKCQSLAWFGFSSDPPTLAHRAVVDAVLGSGVVDKIIVFPAGELDYKSFQTSALQRIEMLELWWNDAEYGSEVILSHFDIQRKRAFKWSDLWQKIFRLSPKIDHYLVVGSDQYSEIIKSWDRGEALLSQAKFIIVPRIGFELDNIPEHHILLQVDPIPGSSTEVRQGHLGCVDDSVKKYIIEYNLYQ